jgi:hypothetical protein
MFSFTEILDHEEYSFQNGGSFNLERFDRKE